MVTYTYVYSHIHVSFAYSHIHIVRMDFGGPDSSRLAVSSSRLPNGVRTNNFFSEVPQYTIMMT